MNNNILADRLKSKRKEFGITRKELAKNLDVAHNVVDDSNLNRIS